MSMSFSHFYFGQHFTLLSAFITLFSLAQSTESFTIILLISFTSSTKDYEINSVALS